MLIFTQTLCYLPLLLEKRKMVALILERYHETVSSSDGATIYTHGAAILQDGTELQRQNNKGHWQVTT